MSKREIIIGSRGSDLALWQANHIKSRLESFGAAVRIEIIKTQGDIIQHLSFDKMEGKGFFTKELEQALLENRVDLAVHSFKDLETTDPEGLEIAAITDRADPRDVILIRKESVDKSQKWDLARESVIGTSSARRKVQIRRYRPDLKIDDIRGNVPTRVNKLRDGQFDAIVLAKAGLDRLNYDVSDLHMLIHDPLEFIPAPAQGALACQIRRTDDELREILRGIHDEEIAETTRVERKVLNLFHGGCQLPLGAHCLREGDSFTLHAVMAPTVSDEVRHIVLQQEGIEGLPERAVDALKKKIS